MPRAIVGLVRGWSVLSVMLAASVVLAEAPKVTSIPGKPVLLLSGFDLAPLGYSTEEFFVSGTASSYALAGESTPDGHLARSGASPSKGAAG